MPPCRNPWADRIARCMELWHEKSLRPKAESMGDGGRMDLRLVASLIFAGPQRGEAVQWVRISALESMGGSEIMPHGRFLVGKRMMSR